MENGIIPLRYGSLPGTLRLPRRYEHCTQKMSSIGPASNENETERMHDLMKAVMWVKQELVLLRQHDILLKRQFSDIHDTIKSMCKSRRYKDAVCTSNTSLQSTGSTEFGMDNYSVRSASSVTALDDSDEEEDEHCELLFRPRTSSMKTTRDLAALARRRGSKELI
ncbi:hypothetical protein MAR_036985 [Mya arenaria]|uniref:Uncharacterized protein n=2 Tax=Mya arenaria TaxID=6604 RepID=A0ABY7FRH9_MYAAR|nr:uncharacterized protein LOC128214167 [Mya arenaria]WAR23316.1 hypothetical protein MAR_036985 [Mya arenaria]